MPLGASRSLGLIKTDARDSFAFRGMKNTTHRTKDFKKKFATDWVFSYKGRLLFSSPLKILIKLIIKIYPFQILIRYIVADAVIRGARSSEMFG